MGPLSERLGIPRSYMWWGLGVFHGFLGTSFLRSGTGTSGTTTGVILFAVAAGMIVWGVKRHRTA